MSAEILICNAALREASLNTIASFDEESTEARACKLFYPKVRDEVLRAHPWNFAQKLRTLALLELPDAYDEFKYAYSYPNDCLRINKVRDPLHREAQPFEIMRHPDQDVMVILTDAPNAIAKYTVATENPDIFDAAFERALTLSLSSRLAAGLRKDGKAEQALYQKYMNVLDYARVSDEEEAKDTGREAIPWLNARLGFGEDKEL